MAAADHPPDVRLAAAIEQIAEDVHTIVRDQHADHVWSEFQHAGERPAGARPLVMPALLWAALAVILWIMLGDALDARKDTPR